MKKVNVINQMAGYTHAFGTSKTIENSLGLDILMLENNMIYASYDGNQNHGGYPGVLHGGLITTILDEISGWSIMVFDGGHNHVTAQFNTSYLRPAELSKKMHAVASVKNKDGKKVTVESYLFDDEMNLLAKGESLFIEKQLIGVYDDPSKITNEPIKNELPEYVVIPDNIFN